MEARNGDQRSGASAQPTARSRRETPDRRCPSRNHRDFTLARATAEPLALKQNKGVCAAAKRRPVGSRETGQKGTRRRVSIAPPLGGTRDRVPPASDTSASSREGSTPLAETLRGSVHESPVRRLPHAHMHPFDCMPAVRTPEASQNAR